MSYMTLMVPHTLHGIGIVWSPHVCIVPLTLYGICIIWPPHVHMIPPNMKGLHVLDHSNGPHALYGIGIMVPHMYNMTLMVPHYLIWNRYLMVPHMYVWSPTYEVSSYLILLLWSPIAYME